MTKILATATVITGVNNTVTFAKSALTMGKVSTEEYSNLLDIQKDMENGYLSGEAVHTVCNIAERLDLRGLI